MILKNYSKKKWREKNKILCIYIFFEFRIQASIFFILRKNINNIDWENTVFC